MTDFPMNSPHFQDAPEARGIRLRTAALEDLILEQENYLALLRMRRVRLARDLVVAAREKT